MRAPILALLLAFSLAAAQEFSHLPAPVTARKPDFGIYAAEAGGALAGALVGASLGWATGVALYYTGNDVSLTALVGGLVGVTAATTGCAGGTYVVGSAFRQDGRYLPTLAWTAGTIAVGAGLLAVGTRTKFDISVVGIVVLAATPVVTTYGYNRSRPKQAVGSRFLPGSVALGSVTDADGFAHPSLDVRLVTMRF